MSERDFNTGRVLRILIVVLIIVAFLLYFTVLRPRPPQIVATLLDLRRLEYQLTPVVKLNATLGLVISVDNPNYARFNYKDTKALAYYRGNLVAQTPIKADTIPARSTRDIITVVDVILGRLVTTRDFLLDVASGHLNFTAEAITQGSANVIGLLIHATAYTTCEAMVFLQDKHSVADCESRVEI